METSLHFTAIFIAVFIIKISINTVDHFQGVPIGIKDS